MKHGIATMFAAAAVLAATPVRAQVSASAPTDLGRLQGTWTVVSASANGLPMPSQYANTMRRVAIGDTVTITLGEQLFFRATVTLDQSRTPKTIDYHMIGGPSAGATQLGIYAIAGDTVRFCFGSPNAARPGDFSSTAGDGRVLSTWVRAHP